VRYAPGGPSGENCRLLGLRSGVPWGRCRWPVIRVARPPASNIGIDALGCGPLPLRWVQLKPAANSWDRLPTEGRYGRYVSLASRREARRLIRLCRTPARWQPALREVWRRRRRWAAGSQCGLLLSAAEWSASGAVRGSSRADPLPCLLALSRARASSTSNRVFYGLLGCQRLFRSPENRAASSAVVRPNMRVLAGTDTRCDRCRCSARPTPRTCARRPSGRTTCKRVGVITDAALRRGD